MIYYENKSVSVECVCYGCWNNGFEDDARRCFTTRTRDYGDEQDRFGSFPSSNRTEKVPTGGCGVAPSRISPRIMIYYAPTAKAIRQARQARRRRSPCRRSAMLCPLCCFWRSALPEQGAKTIAYNQSKKQRKAKRKESKARNNKTQRKQRNSKGNKTSKAIYKHLTISKAKTDKQDKKKSKRDPRKAYKQTSKREKKSYTIPLYAYI